MGRSKDRKTSRISLAEVNVNKQTVDNDKTKLNRNRKIRNAASCVHQDENGILERATNAKEKLTVALPGLIGQKAFLKGKETATDGSKLIKVNN